MVGFLRSKARALQDHVSVLYGAGQVSVECHAEKKQPNGSKVLNFGTLKCGSCASFVQVFWSASHDAPSGQLPHLPVDMPPKLVFLAMLFAAWLAAASLAVWVWPLLALLALTAGWRLARWSGTAGRNAYIVALGPSFLTMSVVVGYSLIRSDAHYGSLVGEMAAMQFACASGAFAFVRHVLQPGGQ